MNNDQITSRIRPFVFNPANMAPPRSVRPLNLRTDPAHTLQSPKPFQFKRQQRPQGLHQSAFFSNEQQHQIRPKLQEFVNEIDNTSDSEAVFQPPRNAKQPKITRSSNLTSINTTNAVEDRNSGATEQNSARKIDIETSYLQNGSSTLRSSYLSKQTIKAMPAVKPCQAAPGIQSVIIHDSSDDDNETDLTLPDDVLDMSADVLVTNEHAESHSQGKSDQIPFDPNLDPETAIALIKDMQTIFNRIADEGIKLIREMEDMISIYHVAVESTTKNESKLKQVLIEQWKSTRDEAQKLLDTVRDTVGA